MKTFSFAKALTLGTLVLLALPAACGDDDDSPAPMPTAGAGSGGEPSAEGGAGGAAPVMLPPGLSPMPSTEMCGGDSCSSAKIDLASIYVDPCCDATDGCGLNTGFLGLVGATFKETCQSRNQAGDPSDTCAAAEGLKVPFSMNGQTLMVPLDPFPGCCRPDGTCGVVIDKVTSSNGKLPIADFGLGCVDAAPFAGKVVTCSGEPVGGAGGQGAGGQGSGGADSGGAPAGGAGGAQ